MRCPPTPLGRGVAKECPSLDSLSTFHVSPHGAATTQRHDCAACDASLSRTHAPNAECAKVVPPANRRAIISLRCLPLACRACVEIERSTFLHDGRSLRQTSTRCEQLGLDSARYCVHTGGWPIRPGRAHPAGWSRVVGWGAVHGIGEAGRRWWYGSHLLLLLFQLAAVPHVNTFFSFLFALWRGTALCALCTRRRDSAVAYAQERRIKSEGVMPPTSPRAPDPATSNRHALAQTPDSGCTFAFPGTKPVPGLRPTTPHPSPPRLRSASLDVR